MDVYRVLGIAWMLILGLGVYALLTIVTISLSFSKDQDARLFGGPIYILWLMVTSFIVLGIADVVGVF